VIAELSRAQTDDLLREHVVGRIGCHAGGRTYVVPVIYAYDGEALYVASVDGQKIRMMRENPEVCFEVEYEAGSWRSAIAQGEYEELAGAEAESRHRAARRALRTHRAERPPRAWQLHCLLSNRGS
jgi:nitroimidazol reductase NimA-like FMN-containing flavoprotein (pyridoxamine 5'-phosphate oxidase superfamily)